VSRAVLVLTLLSATLPARGEDDRTGRARAHYEVGLGMYHLGNYREALREFTAGYELSPRPEFLINLGQAYRKLHDLDHAQQMFQRYLASTPAEAPDRKQVQELLDEVERTRASEPPPAAEAVTVVAAPPAPAPRSALRRYWWTIPAGAAVVGLALGLTLYFTLPPSQVSCGSATIGCIDLRP
jgi:tetratricopeptide (TPR) repeat protein